MQLELLNVNGLWRLRIIEQPAGKPLAEITLADYRAKRLAAHLNKTLEV